jgi:hypothetical protein
MFPSTDLGFDLDVLDVPAYQELCQPLFDMFVFSRQMGRDPDKILSFQAGLIEILTRFQEQKAELREQGNALGVHAANRLMLISRRIADSVVWRVLGYDRVLIQLLAEHPQTGALDDTVFEDLAQAAWIVEQEDAIVIVNDLTTILRHGDLTVIDRNTARLIETKYGKASSRKGSAIRQSRRLADLVRFLTAGVRIRPDGRDFIVRVDVPLETHHSAAETAIRLARANGYHHASVSECFAVEARWIRSPRVEVPPTHAFGEAEHVLWFHSLMTFARPTTRIAPYGIFPFSHRDCFDLMTGDLLLVTTLNFDELQKQYGQLGLTLGLPEFGEEDRRALQTASVAEQLRIWSKHRFTIGDGDVHLSPAPDVWARIGLELLSENTVSHADRQVIKLVSDLGYINEKSTRLYVGYGDEAGLWA